VDPIGDGGDEAAQEVPGDAARHLLVQFGESELRDPVDGDDKIELALSGPHFGDVDVEEADWIGLELALGRGFAFDLWQAGDPMTLEASMQRRARRLKR
jgi:hypothetical protein